MQCHISFSIISIVMLTKYYNKIVIRMEIVYGIEYMQYDKKKMHKTTLCVLFRLTKVKNKK